MSETNPIPNVIEKPKSEATPASGLDWGLGSVLTAQAELLASAESTLTDWLRRRHDAVLEDRQFIARMHLGADPADAFKAQREWVSRSFQRLAAEVDAYQSATQQAIERVPSWLSPSGWAAWFPQSADNADSASTRAEVTRAAARPLRMANK